MKHVKAANMIIIFTIKKLCQETKKLSSATNAKYTGKHVDLRKFSSRSELASEHTIIILLSHLAVDI